MPQVVVLYNNETDPPEYWEKEEEDDSRYDRWKDKIEEGEDEGQSRNNVPRNGDTIQ
jgi:hypothetical protein